MLLVHFVFQVTYFCSIFVSPLNIRVTLAIFFYYSHAGGTGARYNSEGAVMHHVS